jgi:hypothetical protein
LLLKVVATFSSLAERCVDRIMAISAGVHGAEAHPHLAFSAL